MRSQSIREIEKYTKIFLAFWIYLMWALCFGAFRKNIDCAARRRYTHSVINFIETYPLNHIRPLVIATYKPSIYHRGTESVVLFTGRTSLEVNLRPCLFLILSRQSQSRSDLYYIIQNGINLEQFVWVNLLQSICYPLVPLQCIHYRITWQSGDMDNYIRLEES